MSEVSRLRFGAFEMDLRGEELLEDGRPVKLARQPFKVLRTLVLRAGEIVSRDELRTAVWGEDTHVDFESGLHSCIKQVRAALGDDAGAPRYIETLPRRGYRFLPEIQASVPSTPKRSAGWALVGLSLLAGAAAAALTATRSSRDPVEQGVPLRLVVLPFTDETSPYRGPALADEVVRSLSALDPSRLEVLASTSAARSDPSLTSEVDYVLSGSVSEHGLQTELMSRGSRVWRVEAEDATSLVAALVPHLLLEPDLKATAREPDDPEAFDAYLKARYHLNRGEKGSLELAERYAREALSYDEDYADALVALAVVHVLGRRYEEAARAASRALELEPSAEAHFALALARWYGDWDWAGAGESFQRALLANPGYARAHHWYAYYLTGLGRHEEAIAEIERASRLDPLSPQVQSDVGWFYYFAGRFERAVTACERTLELEPGFELAEACIYEARLALGETTRHPEWTHDPYTDAVWLLRRGEASKAIESLARAIEVRNAWVPMLAVDPRFEVLRSSFPSDYARLLDAAGFR